MTDGFGHGRLRVYMNQASFPRRRLSWLATLAGRPVTPLQHALADQQPPGGAPASGRLPGERQQKPSRIRMPALSRRDAREHSPPARSTPLCCSFCSKDKGSGARLVAGPGVCICSDCIGQSTQALAEKAAPEIALWHEQPASELLASLPRQQAAALQIDADMQERVDTLRDRVSAGPASERRSECPGRRPGCGSPWRTGLSGVLPTQHGQASRTRAADIRDQDPGPTIVRPEP